MNIQQMSYRRYKREEELATFRQFFFVNIFNIMRYIIIYYHVANILLVKIQIYKHLNEIREYAAFGNINEIITEFYSL